MDAIEAINRRQGVMHYRPEPVEQEKIEAVLRAAITAPSPLNLQPWSFVVVTDPRMTGQIGQYLRRVQAELLYGGLLGMSQEYASRMLGLYFQLERVPCFILACLEPKARFASGSDQRYLRDWYLMSMGAAVENLMVAATALGLGTRWFTGFALDEEGQAVKRLFGIPEDVDVVAISTLGYHDEPIKERPEQQLADLLQFRRGDDEGLARLFRGKLPLEAVLHQDHW
jgi:5,6-dimethylbenzimidazole synthase